MHKVDYYFMYDYYVIRGVQMKKTKKRSEKTKPVVKSATVHTKKELVRPIGWTRRTIDTWTAELPSLEKKS